jgi:acyl-CoA reductase-like NAD-dependent aldehyde dehydrogenase
MSEYKLLIGGDMVATQTSINIINPATEKIIAQCPVAEQEHLDQAVEQAQAAFRSWRHTSLEERATMLMRLVDAVESHADELAELLTLEQGKPLSQARDEVMFSQLFVRHFAENSELPVEVLLDDDSQRVEVHRKPLGVVAGICPWNFPLLITMYKLAPALITGNTVIIKPAPSTPLTSLRLGELAQHIFPPGVLNILADDNSLGQAITSHPGIAKVSFTGFTPTGKRIMASAAGTLKRLTLELGGNDAAIVMDDVDPAVVAEGIFGAAFLNSGQVCIALKRLYVHESIYDAMCDEIAQLAATAVVGDGADASTQFGPVQNKQQFDKVCDYIAGAKSDGRIIAGGDIPDAPGFFVPLTVVRDISDGTRLVDEEPFGPVLPIIKYRDIDDVIERANASPFGLGGSVWSSDVSRAHAVAKQIDSGTVWINQHCVFGPHIPFPPAKESGIGVEWGIEGLHEFTAMQVININKA